MAKAGGKKAKTSDGSAKRPRAPGELTPSRAPPAVPEIDEVADRESLLRDVTAFKARVSRNAEDESSGLGAAALSGAYGAAKNVLDTAMVWNFFLIVALLGWLLVSLVPHFVAKNEFLLDPWLQLWVPFIQPVLGAQMAGIVVQGMITYAFSQDE
jgi:hypothetical protein